MHPKVMVDLDRVYCCNRELWFCFSQPRQQQKVIPLLLHIEEMIDPYSIDSIVDAGITPIVTVPKILFPSRYGAMENPWDCASAMREKCGNTRARPAQLTHEYRDCNYGNEMFHCARLKQFVILDW